MAANTDQIEQVAVYISEFEAQDWMLFQQYHDPISILFAHKVFEQKNASVSMHFDANGTLQLVERNDYLYSRKHASKYPQVNP